MSAPPDLVGGLRGLDDLAALERGRHRVVVDAGTDTVVERTQQADLCAEVEAFAGWSTTLDEPARRIRREILDLVRAQWLPIAGASFLEGRFPQALFRELGRRGAIGASLVGRDGRPPLSRVATCAIMHALEYGDGGLRCAVTIQDSVIQAVVRFGSERQRARWLQPLCEGEVLASFALTEPDAGSDVRAVATSARRDGDGWLLTGRKTWITNAPSADVVLVWARTGERNDDLRGFLVERGTAGLVIEPIAHAASMRAAPVGRITLDRVRVPEDALLPHAWGLTDVNACLDYNRMTVLFGVMGAARFCLETAIDHAMTRRQFDAPIGSRQLVQSQLADMATLVAIGELATLRLATRWQQGELTRFDVSMGKRSTCAAALDVARRARSLLGAQGVDLDRHVTRHLLNLEASSTYGGTHDIHALVMGRLLTGENAF